MNIEEIAQCVGGKFWQKGNYARIYFQEDRKDLSVWIEIEDFQTDDEKNFIYVGSKMGYKFSTENVSSNWIISQWNKYKSFYAIIHEMFIVLSNGYNKTFERLKMIKENDCYDQFFKIINDFATLAENKPTDISLEIFDETLVRFLSHIQPKDDYE
jgi:hypothetical protein